MTAAAAPAPPQENAALIALFDSMMIRFNNLEEQLEKQRAELEKQHAELEKQRAELLFRIEHLQQLILAIFAMCNRDSTPAASVSCNRN